MFILNISQKQCRYLIASLECTCILSTLVNIDASAEGLGDLKIVCSRRKLIYILDKDHDVSSCVLLNSHATIAHLHVLDYNGEYTTYTMIVEIIKAAVNQRLMALWFNFLATDLMRRSCTFPTSKSTYHAMISIHQNDFIMSFMSVMCCGCLE